MLSNVLHLVFMTLHTIAPVAIAINVAVLVWLLVMSRKWKKEDPERYYRKY